MFPPCCVVPTARISILVLTLLGGAFVNIARGQDRDITYGWYELGVGFVESASLVNFGTEPIANNQVEFNPGFRFGIGFGGELTDWLAAELQSGFHYNSIDTISGATSSSGNLYQVPIMANVIFKLPNKSRFVPRAGAGVGTYWEVLDASNLTLGSTTLSGTENTWTFGYQAFAGVAYFFREDMSLGLNYHYGVADGPSWSTGSGGNVKFDRVANHSVAIALSYDF
jgi:opacity protein-like surface antigen